MKFQNKIRKQGIPEEIGKVKQQESAKSCCSVKASDVTTTSDNFSTITLKDAFKFWETRNGRNKFKQIKCPVFRK